MEILNKRFSRVMKALYFCSKAKHQSLEDMKGILKKEIEELQMEESVDQDFPQEKFFLLRSKVNEYNCTLARLSTWWRQRAKARWIGEGDTNSNFFHAFANGCRNGNLIKQIKDGMGYLVEEPERIREIFTEFFNRKWRLRSCCLQGWPPNPKSLRQSESEFLSSDFRLEELELVIKELGNNVAPGVDGITYSSFIKAYWKTIGEDVWKAIELFFSSGKMCSKWKETLVVLILKISSPLTHSNFRPISLCLSIYKIVAKMLLNILS
ncbi:integrator complex subunit 11 [Dendrobium catenatum]|uniref:Integrator complex subunit 11 n=1 Tax=Dendrobium catenatum TaxID=906689 RepID=A0A2I0VL93_9ASPA|nr:integrator complex subunit 11 [Dendrobium catenatum]